MTNHPTQLWISDQVTAHNEIIKHLQQQLCKNNVCTTCITCTQIQAHDHPWVIWATPERSYNLEQMDEIIAASSFQLDVGELRFFIIPQAERLTEQCSNRLLKTIEEPFAGYHFFFLTNRAQALPLTIQSRCVVKKFKAVNDFGQFQEFVQPFLQLQFEQPIQFIKQLDTFDIKEQETKELIDSLYEHWSTKLKEQILDADVTSAKKSTMLVKILQTAIDNPPMTGGAKIFWKNLYLNAHHASLDQ